MAYRQRFRTHVGYGGHYNLNVQVKPSLVNESVKVESLAPNNDDEFSIVKSSLKKLEEQNVIVTNSNFDQVEFVQDPTTLGKDQYHHAFESVLKLEACTSEEINNKNVTEFSDLTKQIRQLKQKNRTAKLDSSRIHQSRQFSNRPRTPSNIQATQKQSPKIETPIFIPTIPTKPAILKESPISSRLKVEKSVSFSSTSPVTSNAISSSHLTIEQEKLTFVNVNMQKDDENGSSSVDNDQLARHDLQQDREEIKQIASTLQDLTKQNHNIPDVNNSIAQNLLDRGHHNLERIMRQLLKERLNKLSDETRLQLEETILMVNAFHALDGDSDGLLTVADIQQYFHQRNHTISTDAVENIMWLLDDQRRGYLTLEDVKRYSDRVNKRLLSWVRVSQVTEQMNLISNKTASKVPSRLVKTAIGIVKQAAMNVSQSYHFYRLLLYAALENQQQQIHLLSALQQLVERFAAEIADVKFEVLFCTSAMDLLDSEIYSLPDILQLASNWEAKLLPFFSPAVR